MASVDSGQLDLRCEITKSTVYELGSGEYYLPTDCDITMMHVGSSQTLFYSIVDILSSYGGEYELGRGYESLTVP